MFANNDKEIFYPDDEESYCEIVLNHLLFVSITSTQ